VSPFSILSGVCMAIGKTSFFVWGETRFGKFLEKPWISEDLNEINFN